MKLDMEFDGLDIPFDMQFGDWLPGTSVSPDAVLCAPQDLTEEEKDQARKNIGAMQEPEENGYVDFNFSEVDYITSVSIIHRDLDDEITGGVNISSFDDLKEQDGIFGVLEFGHYSIDTPVVLRKVHDGVFDHDAATVGQVKSTSKKIAQINKKPEDPVDEAYLKEYFNPLFYSSLAKAAEDINASATQNAIVDDQEAAVAVYSDLEGQTCIVLMSDIDLAENISFSSVVHLRLNGHIVKYQGDYALVFSSSAGKSIVDGIVAGSKLYKNVDTTTSFIPMVLMESGEIIGVKAEAEIQTANNDCCAFWFRSANESKVENCSILLTCNSGEASAYGIGTQTQANVEVKNTHIDVTCNGYPAGIYATASSSDLKVENCTITINSETYAYGISVRGPNTNNIISQSLVQVNSLGSGQGISVGDLDKTINSIAICDTKSIVNCAKNSGIGISLLNTNANIIDCYTNSGHTGIQVKGAGNVYISGGVIGGYTHGLYCLNSPESDLFVNDATLMCKYNEDIPNCDSATGYTCCCYIGLFDETGNTVYFDGCTFTSGNDTEAVDEALVLRANDNTPTTANLSNCIIMLNNPQPIRIEDGSTNNRLSAVNIGINVVDTAGNPITRQNVRDQNVETNIDSNPEHLYITDLLYRRLPNNVIATGKDIDAYYRYSLKMREYLNRIINGE